MSFPDTHLPGLRIEYGELAGTALPIEVQLAAILSREARSATRESSTSIGPGWVYVLTNPAHPDLVKIGFTGGGFRAAPLISRVPCANRIGISA